ncbi:MAG: hypothetical protein K0S55_64, partial [Clostridia bacterium]|nr:hypothetical protein [Clostridia bacterium]
MNKNIRKKIIAIILSLTMIIGLLSSTVLPISAAYPAPYPAIVNVPLELSVSELSGMTGFEDSFYCYVYGFTRPSDGLHNAQIYFYNPYDVDDASYMPNSDSPVSWVLFDSNEVIHFLANYEGLYTFYLKVKEYSLNTIVTHLITVDVKSDNTVPTFVDNTTPLTLNENSGATDIKDLLKISDSDSSQTLTWSEKTAPGHGTLSFSGATASSGGTSITSGGTITYTPTAHFSGSDSFTVQVSDGKASATRTVLVNVLDKTPPTCMITQGTDNWTSFLNDITFDRFFKETVNITITAADVNGSGVKSIQYYKSSAAITETDIKNLTTWSSYTSALSLTPTDAEVNIIYAKITDNAGNVTYINSDGMVFDLQGPVITAEYTKDSEYIHVEISDSGSGVDSVTYTIDGDLPQSAVPDKGGYFTVSSLEDGRYDVVITALDILGNESSYTVNVVSLHTVNFKLFDGDTGSALKTETVEYGNSATAPEDPTRTGFTFKSWDKSFNSITADITVNGTWDISDIIVTPYTGTYDGIAHAAAVVTGTLTGDIVTYSTDDIIFNETCPQYTDAGSHPVYVRVERTGYTPWESGLKNAVIDHLTGNITIIGDPSKTYDGNPVLNPTITKNGSGDVTYSYYNDNGGVIGSVLPGIPSAAGTYWVKAVMIQDTNYAEAEDTRKFTITPLNITGNVLIPETILTGDTVSAAVSGTPEGVTYNYDWKLDGSLVPDKSDNNYVIQSSDYGKTLSVVLT